MSSTEDQIQIFQGNISIRPTVGFTSFLRLNTPGFGSKPTCGGYCGFDRTKGLVVVETREDGMKIISYKPYLPEFICDIHPSVPQSVIKTNRGIENLSPLCLECSNPNECEYCPLTLEARRALLPEYRPYLNQEFEGILHFIALLNIYIGSNLPLLKLVKLEQGYIPGSGMEIEGFEELPKLK